jgi:hypothetical protein
LSEDSYQETHSARTEGRELSVISQNNKTPLWDKLFVKLLGYGDESQSDNVSYNTRTS